MLESQSVKHTGRFCIFACSPRSQVPDWETPSESGRLCITLYAFSTVTAPGLGIWGGHLRGNTHFLGGGR